MGQIEGSRAKIEPYNILMIFLVFGGMRLVFLYELFLYKKCVYQVCQKIKQNNITSTKSECGLAQPQLVFNLAGCRHCFNKQRRMTTNYCEKKHCSRLCQVLVAARCISNMAGMYVVGIRMNLLKSC